LNEYVLSLLFGIVEGLTEFLPVSSTAHLRISEALFHVSLTSSYWKMYTIVIQLGATLCLPVYFRERIRKLLATFPKGDRGDRTFLTHPLSLVIVAFVVTAIPAFLLTKVIGKHLESLSIIGSSLLIGGIVMWIVDEMNGRSEAAGLGATGTRIHTWHMEDMNAWQAVWIGACQILFLPVHTDDGGGNLLRPDEVTHGKDGDSHRSSADERAWMACAGHWLRDFVCCGVRYGCLVYGLG